jgi:dienelactone hydrolase
MINFQTLIAQLQSRNTQSLSFLQAGFGDVDAWRAQARAKAIELLRYSPPTVPLNPEVVEVNEADDVVREKIYFSSAPETRVPALLIRPTGQRGPLPGVVALHDHGGYYIHGKEKVVDTGDDPPHLRGFKKGAYEGVSYATELARQGYVVIAIDALYFGERRIDLSSVTSGIVQQSGRPSGVSEIAKENGTRSLYEELIAKHLIAAGTTWMGLVSHDDRATVSYLASRPEVDASRIGCLGLSFGGMRANWLFGTDPRIKAAVSVGWMCDWKHLHAQHVGWHSWSQYVPGLAEFLELSDIASIGLPGALMVQECSQDELFPLSGMQATCARLEEIFAKAGEREKFAARFYDNPHQFTQAMQTDAFAWLGRWLKA